MAIYSHSYVPYYPKEHTCLHDSLLRNKYDREMQDLEDYFTKIKIKNFDIIYNDLHGTPLKNSITQYQTIYKKDLNGLKNKKDVNLFLAEANRTRRNEVYVKKDILKEYFKNEQKLIEFKEKNKHLFSSMHGKKKEKLNKKYAECW